MEPKNRSSVGWIVGGLVIILLCCLCVAVVLGGSGVVGRWFIRQGPTVNVLPTLPPVSGPTLSPVPMPATAEPVSPDAVSTEHQLASAEVPIADPLDLAQRLKGVKDPPRVVATSAAPIPLGTVKTFWASDVDNNKNFQVDATMVYATAHVYFWVEKGVRYQDSDVKALVDRFETKSYPTDREFFGSEWTPGVDGDVHLYILFAGGLGNSIAGYYSSNDEYSPLVHSYSNAHEMFYLNADNLDLASSYADSTMAHEFQHMIHWGLDRNEESWMNEGFSVLAEMLNGYDVGGADLAYADSPDIPLTFWPSPPESRHYGQGFLFLAYFLDRFGEQATKALVADKANGLDSVDDVLQSLGEKDPTTGAAVTANDVYRDWAAAMVLEDPSVADGRYVVKKDPAEPKIALGAQVDSCPLASQTRTVEQYGIDTIDIHCSGNYTLSFDGATLAKVVPTDAHSGSYGFWSNKGDESDMTLTRAFDLSQATGSVAADYWVWYDLEKDYDYVYFEVSADAGKSWSILKTPSASLDNPSGNAYGPGYTGKSGGSDQAQWLKETVDLSAYAGKNILVRFEYVTDAAVNGEGLVLDDFSIPGINYKTDFESGPDGWQGDGFVRLYNRVPQTYRVVLIEKGTQTTVQDVGLDDKQHGQVNLALDGGENEAILVVVATTRHTWQSAPYRVAINP
jgi:immune inhibitor A